jgi:hypothetical protein
MDRPFILSRTLPPPHHGSTVVILLFLSLQLRHGCLTPPPLLKAASMIYKMYAIMYENVSGVTTVFVQPPCNPTNNVHKKN